MIVSGSDEEEGSNVIGCFWVQIVVLYRRSLQMRQSMHEEWSMESWVGAASPGTKLYSKAKRARFIVFLPDVVVVVYSSFLLFCD